jgi:Ca-activated chloride channel homolog
MKIQRLTIAVLALTLFILSGNISFAQSYETEDKSLSPHFIIKSDDPNIDRLPLKSTSVNVDISGVIADVTTIQVYENLGSRPLEAIYVFPASTRAAVYGMKMQIGERTITARIKERAAAREAYDKAKQAGQSASLLEQQRPNVFQMNVANILPGDVIRVELKYTELLVPTRAVYEFVYPTVVGPRYAGDQFGGDGPTENWVSNPYLKQGELPANTLDLRVNLRAGLPIQDIVCPTHPVDIAYKDRNDADIRLTGSEQHSGNRDFILQYRLAGKQIRSGLLLHEGDKENFFLMMMQPPKSIGPAQIPPREYIFIVDVSGSMRGFPLDISKKLIKDLIGGLRPTDRFNVLLFAGASSIMSSESLPATPGNIQQALNLIDHQSGGGGTRLLPALKRALSLTRESGIARSIVIATDGYVAVEEKAFDLIRDNLGEANMFAFGIGSSVNRHLIEGMARVGMGEPFIITRRGDAVQTATRFRELIASPVLTDISIDFQGFDAYDVEPVSIPDLFSQRPVILFGKYRGRPQGTIRLQGRSGDRPYVYELDAAQVKPTPHNNALRYLWARHRIAQLSDYNLLRADNWRIETITQLGLSYNLLTAHTSFIAIDTEKRNRNGQWVTVEQPLPLPQGVANSALGMAGGATRAMQYKAALPLAAPMPPKASLSDESAVGKVPSIAEKTDLKKEKSEPGTKPALVFALKKIEVSEGLDEQTVRTVLEQNLSIFESCRRQVAETPLPETFTIRLSIDKNGRIAQTVFEDPQAMPQQFRHCLLKAISQIQFPKPQSGKVITLKAEYRLKN